MTPRAAALAVLVVSVLGARGATVHAEVAAIAPAADVRRAVLVGTNGEVYAGDGKGAWTRTQRGGVADPIVAAGRVGDAVVALGDGIVYRYAENGWSAIRLAQKTRAVMSSGGRAVAGVGREILALDQQVKGEAVTLATAGSAILGLGAGKTIVFQTDRGLFRLDGKKVTAIKNAPRRVNAFAGDRWALVDRGLVDLKSGRITPWPADVTLAAAAASPDDKLVAVAAARGGGFALLVASPGGKAAAKLERSPITGLADGAPVGVAMDASGRVIVALRDGRIALRDGKAWTLTAVTDALPAPRPGAPPAISR